MAKQADSKSYLDSFASLAPWGRTTPKSTSGEQTPEEGLQTSANNDLQRGPADHKITNRHRLSLKHYPQDCPKLDVQWFHAVDIAKRKPDYVTPPPTADNKPPPKPKKWNAFSADDSRAIEAAFQKLADEEDRVDQSRNHESLEEAGDMSMAGVRTIDGPNLSLEAQNDRARNSIKVPVNEDYLFDVDVQERELGPAYWLGPIYDVRRGTWFDGSTLMPVDENLAIQLEEGYLKTKPWKYVPTEKPENAAKSSVSDGSGLTTATLSETETNDNSKSTRSARARAASGKSRSTSIGSARSEAVTPSTNAAQPPVLTHRLFGSYMNHVATYQGTTTAFVLSDDFLSKFSSAMIQRFTGGAGTRYIRGYTEVIKKKAPKEPKRPNTPTKDSPRASSKGPRSKSISVAGGEDTLRETDGLPSTTPLDASPESRIATLERKISSFVAADNTVNPERQAEEERQREEQEIQEDYRDTSGERQDREIDHLILVTHGIGQRLGARFESFNFIHDVNELRKTMKLCYSGSPDLQALNGEADWPQKNCRVQVLPICWRHLLDFPQQGLRHNRREHDLAEVDAAEDDAYPSLDAITVEGVPALRNVIADLALDILLYQTPAYKNHISRIVVGECNRILNLFKHRNPNFKGRVSMIGHSLGSAIMFDILSDQAGDQQPFEQAVKPQPKPGKDLKLDFGVDSFFCIGSPIGLFQMLKGRKIGGRTNPNQVTLDGLPDSLDDPFADTPYSKLPAHAISDAQHNALMSSPKCRQLYNIFHPTDPIGYRLEPLITPAMSSLKPQLLPYTGGKSWISAPGQGFTGIPAKVGQSFSGFWSNISSGLTNSFINRSLGLSAEDAAKLNATPISAQAQAQAEAQAAQAQAEAQSKAQRERAKSQSLGAGTNITGGGVIPQQAIPMEKTASAPGSSSSTAHEHKLPTMIDQEMETLYAGFQKSRKSAQESDGQTRDFGESPLWSEAESRGRKLRREEAKVRALNSNGRVDYSIQEGFLEISFLGSIANHLAYWTDADVGHFMLSQLLSRQSTLRPRRSTKNLTSSQGRP
ncbi:MAG: hypothetical protein Q9162_004778 [Coniocarpon cinnabarinum]